MKEHTEARIDLHKHYLRGKLIAAIAETVGDVTPGILAKVGELSEACDVALRFREELSERTYSSGVSLGASVSYSAHIEPDTAG